MKATAMTAEHGAKTPSKHPETPPPLPASQRGASPPTIVEGVLRSKRPLDEQLESSNLDTLEDERDRALVRAIVATVIRRLGTLRHLLTGFLDRGLPGQCTRGSKARC